MVSGLEICHLICDTPVLLLVFFASVYRAIIT